MSGVGSLRTLAAVPGFGRLLGGSLIARLQTAMINLALVLYVVRGGGSYAVGGAASASWSIGAAVSSPLLSRAAQRRGLRPVLLPAAVLTPIATGALALVPARSAVLLCAVALVSGATLPPASSVTRGLWPSLLADDALVGQAYALEASAQELLYIAGPALVGWLVAVGPAGIALLAGGLLTFAGTVLLLAGAGRAEDARSEATARPAAAVGGRRLVVVLLAGVGALQVAGFSAAEVGLAGIATEAGSPGVAGLLLASWAAGSMLGGLTLGARFTGGSPLRRVPVFSAVIGGGIALVSVGPGLVGVGVLLFVAGVAIAPALGGLYLALQQAAGPSATEVFGWLSSGLMIGGAVGAAYGGAAVGAVGGRSALLLAALAPATASLVGLAAVRTARRPTPVTVAVAREGAGAPN